MCEANCTTTICLFLEHQDCSHSPGVYICLSYRTRHFHWKTKFLTLQKLNSFAISMLSEYIYMYRYMYIRYRMSDLLHG